jgi:hypothetical protein
MCLWRHTVAVEWPVVHGRVEIIWRRIVRRSMRTSWRGGISVLLRWVLPWVEVLWRGRLRRLRRWGLSL